MFPGPLGQSLSGKALEGGIWSYKTVNIRDFAQDVHKTVDGTPYGGGAGMVMKADLIEKAILALSPAGRGLGEGGMNPPAVAVSESVSPSPLPSPQGERGKGRLIYLSPRGKPLTQKLVQELSREPVLTLLCGRYEGVDQRVLDAYEFEEISIGDYVLSGGEPAALILMDACIRLLPGVMGNEETPREESFAPATGGLLEYPHYTRPAEWIAADGNTYKVPEILASGDHGKVAKWRHEQAEKITRERRPDLLRERDN